MHGTFGALGRAIIVGILLQTKLASAVFSCDGRVSGYYADIDTGCQVYHMCDGLGRQFSYSCPNATLFQQRMLICDHWYMVNCSKSESDYNANYLIGQREKPFVEDVGNQPYRRTPRPDLTTQPSEEESNIIYRTGRAHSKSSYNLVGADTEEEVDSDTFASTNEPSYAVPSHWSTEYTNDEVTTFRASTESVQPTSGRHDDRSSTNIIQKNYRKSTTEDYATVEETQTTSVYKTTIEKSTNSRKVTRPETNSNRASINAEGTVNFGSNFRATTPVYPKPFELPNLSSDKDIGLLPPLLKNLVPKTSDTSTRNTEQPVVNFESNFEATTPVYPKPFELPSIPQDTDIGLLPPKENISEEAPVKNLSVNFFSNFKATTPVYPKLSELPKIPEDNNIGLLPPGDKESVNEEKPKVNFESNYKATTPVYPKAFELPPGDLSNIPLDFLLPTDSNLENRSNQPIQTNVNFQSNYNGTTPVYPKHVESTSPLPQDVGLLPPVVINDMLHSDVSLPSSEFEPPKTEGNGNGKRISEKVPSTPSKFYEPPKLEPDYTQNPTKVKNVNLDVTNRAAILQGMAPEQWRTLRKKLLIPDYEFPLDHVSRPSYEGGLSSFQVRPALVNE